jgi:hypothetical protein
MLHRICLSLARHPRVVGCTARVVGALDARDRLARIAALFTFVSHVVAGGDRGDLRDGVDMLVRVAGPEAAPAVLLAALLKAAGERAQVDYARDVVFVRVEIEPADASRLPPHAALIVAGRRGRVYLPLWVRHAKSPLGFLPLPTREGLARRRFIA